MISAKNRLLENETAYIDFEVEGAKSNYEGWRKKRNMINKRKFLSIVTVLLLLVSLFPISGFYVESTKADSIQNVKTENDMILWFDRPANEWLEAFPIGNGRLGAMVFGGASVEKLQLNEESLWAGAPVDDNNQKALEFLPEIRKLLLEGKNSEAKALADKYILATPKSVRSYQTLGDLSINLGENNEVENYKRELDMEKGIVKISYSKDGIQYTREIFTSAEDDVLVVRMKSSQPGKINADLSLTRNQDAESISVSDNEIAIRGQIIDKDQEETKGPLGKHMRFESRVLALPVGGEVTSANGKLNIKEADAVTLLLTAATDYDLESMDFDRSKDPGKISQQILDKAVKKYYPYLPNAAKKAQENQSEKSYQRLKDKHVNDHSKMFNRVDLNLGKSPNADLPTNKRLEAVKNGAVDPQLIAQYFQFGRYLLMGSSRSPGVLPANLQGIWNQDFNAPWGSDFHTNINLQMNYWPAEVGNLTETIEPLSKFLEALQIPGSVTAKKMYGADGWTVHHLTDVFGRTGVHDGIEWGMFPMGGPWMTLPLWEHYEFNADKQYLKQVAYPLMKGSAEFVLDFLVEDSQGRLVTAPSYSPENSFKLPDSGRSSQLTYAPTMDIEIIHALFSRVIAASEILGVDKEFKAKVEAALEKLPPLQISKRYGTIQEWIEDYEEVEPGHRHVSHLFALHPGDQITADKTPELYEAAKRTIERRLSNGGAGTGWSRAWTINFFARFKDGDKAYENVVELLRQSTASNLFDLHPPFQIDGNFGGTAGIAEMLVQSHEGEIGKRTISILPALPYAWSDGSFDGLRARGDFEIGVDWKAWRAKEIKIKSLAGNKAKISYPKINGAKIVTQKGKAVKYTVINDNQIEFNTSKDTVYIISDIPEYLPLPNVPDGLTLTRESDQAVQLKWTGSQYASSYSVYRKAPSESDFKLVKTDIAETVYTDYDAPVDDGPYTYAITAVNKTGESPKSSSVQEKEKKLVLSYDFENLSDGIKDGSKFANNGTIHGGITQVDGVDGKAIQLDGTGYINVPDSDSLDLTEEATFDMWVYRGQDTTSGWGSRLIDKKPVSNDAGYMLDLQKETGKVRFIGPNGGNMTNIALPTGQWSHVKVTYSMSERKVKIYINGKLDLNVNISSPIPKNTLPLRIGANQDGGEKFVGKIDKVRIYNYVVPNE
ncbi:glycoside hydrolase N-terminal domain-containing protein [Neobacillus sp. NPDC058068]|uniref:glycosyl hydrolase family 95 catalytic domain-containing protein n=1 Tax=Neobacillus sp. NPDC058068 TaxID=3346325 RepID=UPI0036DF912C